MDASYRQMLEFIHHENLARFHALLVSTPDESYRDVLRKMIADETSSYALQVRPELHPEK